MQPHYLLKHITASSIRASVALIFTGLLGHPLLSDYAFTRSLDRLLGNEPSLPFNCAWGDYDNDGWVDLFVGDGPDVPNSLYHNNGDGTLSRVTEGEIVFGESSTADSTVWADYDNDGNIDLFVSYFAGRHGALTDPDIIRDRFYRNNGDGSFTRITEGAWVNDNGDAYGSGAAWADIDNDGFVDLFVGNALDQGNFLYLNNGEGTMTDIGGDTTMPYFETHGATWSDSDNDGDQDLLIVGQGVPQFRNKGDGTFDRVSTGDLPNIPGDDYLYDFGIAAGDYDNDGDMDLALASFLRNRIYRNDGTGDFTELLDGVIDVEDSIQSYSTAWVDYDNDGYLDLFFANFNDASTPHLTETDNFLYHNDGDGTFTAVMEGEIVTSGGINFSAAWADFDNDGDMDLVMGNGTIWPEVTQPFLTDFFVNQGGANHWILLNLVGTDSNRSAIGAKVRIESNTDGKSLKQMREVSGGSGAGSQNDLRVHFGLGEATVVDLLRIEWPSGLVQEFRDVTADRIITITEGLQWGGYPLSSLDGDVDTGNWLGWLNINPASYLWSYSLNGWIYMEEPAAEAVGAWAYFYK